MKKTAFFAIVALSAMLVSCNKPAAQSEEKETATAQKSEAVASLRVAYDLAKYGYEVESATALIEAANIMVGIPQAVLDAEAQKTANKKAVNDTKNNVKEIFNDTLKI